MPRMGSKILRKVVVTDEKINKRIAELQAQLSKLYKVKSASPLDIIERTRAANTEITRLQSRLRGR